MAAKVKRPRGLNAKPAHERFWDYVNKTGVCWLWTGATHSQKGYGIFGPKNGKTTGAHRFSWELHFGRIPAGLCVLHRCDVRTCVRPDHLFVGTPKDNTQDMLSKAREAHGEKAGTSKLTAEDVQAIRAAYKPGVVTQEALARQYGIDQSQVSHIVRRRAWRRY